MKNKYNRIACALLCLVLCIACQNSELNETKDIEIALSSDNGRLDLAEFTFEQQQIEKKEAAGKLADARENRVVVNPDELQEIEIDLETNIAVYARTTENVRGKKSYNRLKRKKNGLDPCMRFIVKDDAQRYFLARGGPKKDLFGLDPDGDGFACDWDPEPFTKVTVQ